MLENMFEDESFSYDGREFVIKTTFEGDRYSVREFLDECQVSPDYTIDIGIHTDHFLLHQENLIDKLKSLSRSDINDGVYFKDH